MTVRISIVMATFNGGPYLRKQLDSLAQQIFLPIELVVGDDGSTDDTLTILYEFSTRAPFPVRINRNRKNLGYADNFLETAKLCDGDWIAFCDQDDVWLPNKLLLAADAITRNTSINLILQNAEICNSELNRSGRLFPNAIPPGTYDSNTQFGFWVWLGFLQTVRAELLTELPFSARPENYFRLDGVQSHDKWTCMLSNALGGICVLGDVVALYRRHPRALTGSYAKRPFFDRVSQARRVKSSEYLYLSKVASQSAQILRNILLKSQEKKCRANKLEESARYFDKLAVNYGLRFKLYEDDNILLRLYFFTNLVLRGSYIGPRFLSLGILSAMKDFIVAIVGNINPDVA